MAQQVLLVEDSQTQALFYQDILLEMGFQVQIAGDGRDALTFAYENHPDLIILDINLPDMSGFQVCSRLHRADETRQIPIIILSERDSAQDDWEGLQAGAVDYIPKDKFAVDTLSTSIRQLIAGS
jgi:DNA-binding response OmpR family regulator